MRRAACFFVALVVLALAPAVALGSPGPLSSRGRHLRDPLGRVVILHGLFAAWKQAPYYPAGVDSATDPAVPSFTAGDADLVRRLGVNGVRLAWYWEGLEPTPGVYSQTYLNGIAGVESKLAARGVYTVLDAHQDQYDALFGNKPGFPAWSAITDGKPLAPAPADPAYAAWKFPLGYFKPSTQRAFASLYANRVAHGRGIRDAFAAAWRVVAQRFRRSPMVAGYDLVNEPFPANLSDAEPQETDCSAPAGCATYDQGTLEPFQLALARAVRTVDRVRPMFIEPTFFFNSGTPAHFIAPPRALAPVGLSFHNQCPTRTQYSLTHDPAIIVQGHTTCPPIEAGVMRNAASTASALGGPELMTEVAPTSDSDTEGLNCLLERADYFHAGYTYGLSWSNPNDELRRLHDESAAGGTAPFKELVLARVFPRAIAGRSFSYAFDVRTGHFTMTYVPARRGRAATVISVPVSIQYPHGYAVTVSGARVLSGRNASLLRLRARRGARIVSVRLVPRQPGDIARPAFPACRLDP